MGSIAALRKQDAGQEEAGGKGDIRKSREFIITDHRGLLKDVY